jgi:ubiquinone biosynthesis protein UbiJ
VQVTDHYQGDADVTLRGSPFAFAQLAGGDTLGARIELQGDTELGQRFRSVLQQVEIDWEETLSGVTGDLLAHQIGNLVRGFARWGGHLSETLLQNTSEYLQEERRELPPPVSVNGFLDDVDMLRADVDRLEARIARLAGRITQGSGPQ